MNPTLTRRRILQRGLQCGLASSVWTLANAQTVTTTPLPDSARIFVGFPPGGAPDIVARRVAELLQGRLARTVIVENRPGAGGRIAADAARALPADGNTLLLNPAGMLTINPHTYKKLSYEPFKDFAPLSLAALIDFGFAVGPAVPAEVKTIADFQRWARANPGKASYGSPAAGAPPHFVGEALSRSLGITMMHVPYRGSGPALNEVMGGQIASLVVTLGDLVPPAKASRLRILASTGPARSRFTPDVATFAEQQVPGLDMRDWFGLYIAGTPTPEVLARVAPIVRAALATPAYAEALAVANLEAASSTPRELDQLAQADFQRWAPIVKASGFVADV